MEYTVSSDMEENKLAIKLFRQIKWDIPTVSESDMPIRYGDAARIVSGPQLSVSRLICR
jgi:hypothetical protein